MSQNVINLYSDGLSIRQVANRVGFSPSKVRKILVSTNTPVRSAREGLRLHKRNDSPLSVEMIQRIEGELLGDGCLKKRTCQSKFSFANSNREYAHWLAGLFIKNNVDLTGSGVRKEKYYHKNWNRWFVRYNFCTLCSVQFEELELRWYSERRKVVPPDLIISPNLVLHWFLGDGSLPKKEYAIFCTDSFSYEEVCFLSDELNRVIGIASSPTPYKTYHRLFVPKTSVPALLDYMGDPPFSSMSYKWDLTPIGRINHKIDIPESILCELYIKNGLTRVQVAERLNCAKSTIDKKLKFYGIRRGI